MPRERLKVCPTPGCPTLIPEHDRGCEEHKVKPRRSNAKAGRNRTWYAASRAYLRDHPDCEAEFHAEPPILRPAATEVHHLDGLGPLGPRGYDPSNWLACCKSCHARFTGAEFGFGAR